MIAVATQNARMVHDSSGVSNMVYKTIHGKMQMRHHEYVSTSRFSVDQIKV